MSTHLINSGEQEIELAETTDPGIFKSEYEKNLYKKIKELRKYFLNIIEKPTYLGSWFIINTIEFQNICIR